jgi:hypothetical protein
MLLQAEQRLQRALNVRRARFSKDRLQNGSQAGAGAAVRSALRPQLEGADDERNAPAVNNIFGVAQPNVGACRENLVQHGINQAQHDARVHVHRSGCGCGQAAEQQRRAHEDIHVCKCTARQMQ